MRAAQYLALASIIALASPARAIDVTLKLNDQQQQGLLQVLDRATKDGGLAAANNGTIYFYNLLKQAVETATAEQAAKRDADAAAAAKEAAKAKADDTASGDPK
jgi:hypothetical protein